MKSGGKYVCYMNDLGESEKDREVITDYSNNAYPNS